MAISIVVSTSGCAGGLSEARAEGMHDMLDVVTDVVEPAKQVAEATCETAEAVVEARADSDGRDHTAEIKIVRVRCDRISHAFHLARSAQLKARLLIDQARELGGDERVGQALAAIDDLQTAVRKAFDTWETERQAIASGR